MAETRKVHDKSLLERHWPLAVSCLAVVILCFTYFAFYSTAPSSARSLILAIVPDIAASLLIAVGLYLLLNRDFRTSRETAPGSDLHNILGSDIGSLNSLIQRLSDDSGVLKMRNAVPALRAMFDGSDVISIMAVSGLGLINHHRGLLEEQLSLGRRLRVMLLDADQKDALASWDRLSNPPMNTPEEDIRSSLRMLASLAGLHGHPGSCQVKVSDTLFPWSLIICQKPRISQIQVELHAYRRAPEDRPNILLTDQADPHWFQFFAQQFDMAWDNARMTRR